jgi:hypothetical protein
MDPKKLIKKNRAVDPKQLEELATVLKALKEHGVKGAEYNIVLPFTRRPTHKTEEEDPRTIHLRSQ